MAERSIRSTSSSPTPFRIDSVKGSLQAAGVEQGERQTALP
jgi:hypothetical protein